MGKDKKDDSSSSSSSEGDKKDKKEKKVKTKKPKQVIASSQTFSKRFASFFNNKKLSDFTIKIGEESIPAHKFVLQSNSDFFDKLEGDSFSFASEDDQTAAKSLLKFYYEGLYEYTEESAVVIFTILANKYKTKNFSEFKLPAKVLLNGVIAYIEKDLSNRIGEFDALCESVNFKKMEKEDLTKLYAKKKWLQKSSSFLNQIILKDMDDGSEEGSDKDSEKSDEDEEDEDDEEGGSGGKVCEIDLKLSHSSFANSFNKKTKLISVSTGSWYTCITKKPSDKFAIECGSYFNPVMVGMIPKEKFQQNSSNYNTGHCWYVSSNYLYGQNVTGGNSMSGSYSAGSIIGMEFFRKKGVIGFYLNGSYIRDAFQISDKKVKMFPILDVCGSGVSFKFVKPKFKKPKK